VKEKIIHDLDNEIQVYKIHQLFLKKYSNGAGGVFDIYHPSEYVSIKEKVKEKMRSPSKFF